MIYADQRWIGNHGIGRFARHVLASLDYRPIALTSNPAAALDSWRLSRALRSLTSEDLFFRRVITLLSPVPRLLFLRYAI